MKRNASVQSSALVVSLLFWIVACAQPLPPEHAVATDTALPTDTPTPAPTRTPADRRPPPTSASAVLPVADLVEQAREGVVNILGVTGGGSGFIVDSSGYILTNEHVSSQDSPTLIVVFDDGQWVEAHVIATDANRDIALLKVEAPRRELTVLPFATETREGEA